jgi:hypothetical protein
MSQLHDVQQSHIALSTLYPAHVVAMKIGEFRQFLLGYAVVQSQFADAFSD